MALGACKGWTTAHPLAVVCWLCGKSHEDCVNQLGSGHVRIKDEWEHTGVVLSAVKPKQRPPKYGLHGAHRIVCYGFTGFTMHYVTNMRLHKKECRSGSSSTWTP